jgi:very-short-patch-repair endonuclease
MHVYKVRPKEIKWKDMNKTKSDLWNHMSKKTRNLSGINFRGQQKIKIIPSTIRLSPTVIPVLSGFIHKDHGRTTK